VDQVGFFRDELAFLTLRLNGHAVDALVDTGFSGEVMVERATIADVRLPKLGVTWYEMADGERIECEEFEGVVEWLGGPTAVVVTATPAAYALVGMGLLVRGRLEIDRPRSIVRVTDSP
jgi:predicted aspartyl protease